MTMPLSVTEHGHDAAPANAAPGRPLTRVQLVRVPGQLEIRLRFGSPARVFKIARQRRVALFLSGAVFCRLRREQSSGQTHWQLLILMTAAAQANTQQVDGVTPGVHHLVHAEGELPVNQVLQQIGAISAQGIDAAEVAPAYWRTLHNRLSAAMVLPDYTVERHAGYLASRVAL
jgi:hypothetical protein